MSLHATEPGDSRRPDGPFGSYIPFYPFRYFSPACCKHAFALHTCEILALILVVLFSNILKVYNCLYQGLCLTAVLFTERTWLP